MTDMRVGFFDKEGREGDVFWVLRQKSNTNFQIIARHLRNGTVHTDHYTLIQDPVTGIDAHDLQAINTKIAEAITIVKNGSV